MTVSALQKMFTVVFIVALCFFVSEYNLTKQYFPSSVEEKDTKSTSSRTATTTTSKPSSSSSSKPFSPWDDLIYTMEQPAPTTASNNNNDFTSGRKYSSFHCFGAAQEDKNIQLDADSLAKSIRPNHNQRTCRYNNLYYRTLDQTFHYVASPKERAARQQVQASSSSSSSSAADLLHHRVQVNLNPTHDAIPKLLKQNGMHSPWAPIWHEDENDFFGTPPTTIASTTTSATTSTIATVQANAVFLLYRSFHAQNIGHFIWDDLLSLFSMLDLCHLGQDPTIQAVPLMVELPQQQNARGNTKNYGGADPEWRCSPWNSVKWQKCVKIYNRTFPALFGIQPDCSGDIFRTGNWFTGPATIGVWSNHAQQNCSSHANGNVPVAEYIRLPTVLVGTGRLNFFGCVGDCSVGRGPQYWRFRQYMMRHLFPEQAEQQHQQRGLSLSQGKMQEQHTRPSPPRGYITFSLPVGSSRPQMVSFFEAEIAWATSTYGEDVVRVEDLSKLSWHEQAKLMSDTAVLFTNHGGVGVASIFLSPGAAAFVYTNMGLRLEANFYESQNYFRVTWISPQERIFVNRTTALLEMEVEKTSREWPHLSELFAGKATNNRGH